MPTALEKIMIVAALAGGAHRSAHTISMARRAGHPLDRLLEVAT